MNGLLALLGLVGWGIVFSIVTFPLTGIILALPVSIVWYVGDAVLHDDRETISRRMLKTLAISYALYLFFFVCEALGQKGFASLSTKSQGLGHPYVLIGGLIIVSLPAFGAMKAIDKYYRSAFAKNSVQKLPVGWKTTGLFMISVLLTLFFLMYTLAHMNGCC